MKLSVYGANAKRRNTSQRSIHQQAYHNLEILFETMLHSDGPGDGPERGLRAARNAISLRLDERLVLVPPQVRCASPVRDVPVAIASLSLDGRLVIVLPRAGLQPLRRALNFRRRAGAGTTTAWEVTGSSVTVVAV